MESDHIHAENQKTRKPENRFGHKTNKFSMSVSHSATYACSFF